MVVLSDEFMDIFYIHISLWIFLSLTFNFKQKIIKWQQGNKRNKTEIKETIALAYFLSFYSRRSSISTTDILFFTFSWNCRILLIQKATEFQNMLSENTDIFLTEERNAECFLHWKELPSVRLPAIRNFYARFHLHLLSRAAKLNIKFVMLSLNISIVK